MPFTLSHPAAVLPLRRFCPRLDFAGLLIGSIIPDIGYYIPGLAAHRETHSLAGIVFPGLPVGLMLLALLHWLKLPLCFVLPQPHRAALTPLAANRRRWPGPASLAVGAASVLLGAWTHIAWDGFTHRGRWGPQHLAFLNDPALFIGGQSIPLYEWLQWLSSLAGGMILIWAYRSWLYRQAPAAESGADGGAERWRYFLLGGPGRDGNGREPALCLECGGGLSRRYGSRGIPVPAMGAFRNVLRRPACAEFGAAVRAEASAASRALNRRQATAHSSSW